jgi:hypothetical protein
LRGGGRGRFRLVVGIESGDTYAADDGHAVAEERESAGNGGNAGAVAGARGIEVTRVKLSRKILEVEIAAPVGILDAEERAGGLIGDTLGKVDAADGAHGA